VTLLFVAAIVLFVALVRSLPTWPHSKNWGYYPIGGVSAETNAQGATDFELQGKTR
jgi:hypothetical protein